MLGVSHRNTFNFDSMHRHYGLYSKCIDGFEGPAEHRLAGPTEPEFKQRGVDLTKVGVKCDVAVFQFVEVGMFADESGSHTRSGEKHWRGGAVVGSLAGILGDAPAEFAERHDECAFAVAAMLNIVDEPLATLPLERIRPGKAVLDEVMDSLR